MEEKNQGENLVIEMAIEKVTKFYERNPELARSESHGLKHVFAVYNHTLKAIESLKKVGNPLQKNSIYSPSVSFISTSTEIELASLLHDVDDHKYFHKKDVNISYQALPPPGYRDSQHCQVKSLKQKIQDGENSCHHYVYNYPNACQILKEIGIEASSSSFDSVLFMIDQVSCSRNGNSVPPCIKENNCYHLLIPRWSDRLEAVGARGVVRCYQYSIEKKRPLYSRSSPRPQTEEEVWTFASPQRFEDYTKRGRHQRAVDNDDSMISHYYDKLLHIARPPPGIVKNEYLEAAAKDSVKELIYICLNYGQTGNIDEDYILNLERRLAANTSDVISRNKSPSF